MVNKRTLFVYGFRYDDIGHDLYPPLRCINEHSNSHLPVGIKLTTVYVARHETANSYHDMNWCWQWW